MDILTTPAEMHAWRRAHADALGFVPTMGYLHEGHLALVRRACEENALAAASIFVNPLQFGPRDDFDRYPRDEGRDLRLLREAGVDAVYLPSPAAMYPPHFQTHVSVEHVSRRLEGEARPGHFEGVTTVVLKLFHAIMPERAYFGRKDAQQLRVIQRMVRDLDLDLEIVACDTVRESDGLAMSSRNVYLSPAQRAAAPILYQALQEAGRLHREGERDPDALRQAVTALVLHEPLAHLEYVSLADSETLEERREPFQRKALLSLVVRFGETRLLDNIELGQV